MTEQTTTQTAPAEYDAVTDALELTATYLDTQDRGHRREALSVSVRAVNALTDEARTEYATIRGEVARALDDTEEAEELRSIVAIRRAIHAGMVATPEERDAAREGVCADALAAFQAEHGVGQGSTTVADIRERHAATNAADDELADKIQAAENAHDGTRVAALVDERAELALSDSTALSDLLTLLTARRDDLAAALSDAYAYRQGELTDEELRSLEHGDDRAGVERARRLAVFFGVDLT